MLTFVPPIIAWTISAPAVVAFGIFLTEVLFGQRRSVRIEVDPDRAGHTVILMPAHNEATGIVNTIAKLLPLLPEHTRLLVVADNCSDATAEVARNAGADVLVRDDPDRRGKGFALAYGRDHLSADPPDCVIVLDADCYMEPGAVALLSAAAMRTNRPCQSSNLIQPDLTAPPMVQISNFAFLIKNLIRQRGAIRLGAPALLTGTGMAFPWNIFQNAPLASGDIVEDLALGISLTRAGKLPRFIEDARISSAAASESDTLTQRTRWEHGFLTTAKSHGLPLVFEGLQKRRWPIFWLGLHLLVPPLALLFMAGGGLLLILLALAAIGAGLAPALLLATTMGVSGLAIMVAWVRFGRGMIAPVALLRLPLYALWKIPVYLKLVRSAETQWVRTKRPDE